MKKLLSFLSLVLFLIVASYLSSADFDNNQFVKILRTYILMNLGALIYLGFYKFYEDIFKE